MVKVSHRLAVLGDWSQFSHGAEIAALQPLCVALSQSLHWQVLFYIAALSTIFFLLLGFRQWRSRADRVLALNINIWLPLFWISWSRAMGQDSATCACREFQHSAGIKPMLPDSLLLSLTNSLWAHIKIHKKNCAWLVTVACCILNQFFWNSDCHCQIAQAKI